LFANYAKSVRSFLPDVLTEFLYFFPKIFRHNNDAPFKRFRKMKQGIKY
jgi:hypothetical protein